MTKKLICGVLLTHNIFSCNQLEQMGFVRFTIKTIIFAYAARLIYLFLVNQGIGRHFNNVKPGPCRIVPGISCGSEQISVTEDGLAFITSGLRPPTPCSEDNVKGRMFLFDFNKPNENVTELKIQSETFDLDLFNPHGMDIIEDKNTVKLFVVNHATRESIEIFQYDKKQRNILKHIQTITDEKFDSLNDIAVVDENNFYVTSFLKYFHYPLVMMTQFFFQMPTSYIIHYESGKTTILASGESPLNGITFNKDKKKLFVASFSTGKLLEFSRNNENGSLSLINRHFVGFFPDNIFVDKTTGVLYVGAQKSIINQFLVAQNYTDHCSASAVKITPDSSGQLEVEELLHMNGGQFIDSLSAVVHYKGQYLFGSVFDKLGYCVDRSLINTKK